MLYRKVPAAFIIPPTCALRQCLRHRYSPDNYRGAMLSSLLILSEGCPWQQKLILSEGCLWQQ
jgi:hypothetical protein